MAVQENPVLAGRFDNERAEASQEAGSIWSDHYDLSIQLLK